jgi:hypothetical protein
MSYRIPAGAGEFRVVNCRRKVRGVERRVRVLVFTAHDGFTGESYRFSHREAYEAAVAERASALFKAREQAANQPPKPYATCNKPAPAAQLLHVIKDTLLFEEVERRGYEVAVA